MQFSPIIPPARKIAREDAENSEMLHKWMGTNAIGAPTILFWFVGAIHESPANAERHRNIPRHCEGRSPVAIPWYKGRPENRRDCHAAFAARNDVITGRAILESPLRVLFDTRKSPSERTGIFQSVKEPLFSRKENRGFGIENWKTDVQK